MPSLVGILMWVVFCNIHFLLIRPQRKINSKMRNNLNVGDKVITIGGIVANVTKVEEDVVILEIG